MIVLFHWAKGRHNDRRDGVHISCTGGALLRELEWPGTQFYYERLRECLTRLQGGTISLRRFSQAGSRSFRYRG
jgi:hypothetical protein